MQRDEVVIQDIINAARLVTEFVKGFDKDTFIHDWKTRSAVLYQTRAFGSFFPRTTAIAAFRVIFCPRFGLR